MRKLSLFLAAALIAGSAAFMPAGAGTARAAANPKVAIIVGATGSTTATYRTYGDQVAAAAAKYTTNVVKVYSPAATWSAVKAAVTGASIVVYLGHGNGWPSPYTFDPNYTTKDGFGLNYDVNGDGKLADGELKYYGEPSIRTLQPAPNAVVLLFHLCYASGNSEPGNPAPTLAVAQQRADNYASAFLAAGARAVIANGHSHANYYIDALFTTRRSIIDYWRGAPDYHHNEAVYPSVRSPGSSLAMDPEGPGSYYRSITGTFDLTTKDVTGAAYADTSADPSAMVVPGNAVAALDGAPVFGSVETAVSGADPSSTLAAGTRVRVDALETVVSAVDATPVYRIHTGSVVEGWMTGSALTPRDSAAPNVWVVDDGTGAFSPNGDGSQDTFPISIRLSEVSKWHFRIVDAAGTELAAKDGTSATAALTWAPAAGKAPDGAYGWTLEATDDWGNGPLTADGTITTDTVSPELTVAMSAADVPVFTPNGDGLTDSIGFKVDANEPGTVAGTVGDAAGKTVAKLAGTLGAAGATIAWDGRAGTAYAADGTYTVSLAVTDLAGNRSKPEARTVAVYGALGYVRSSAPVFFPQDGDTRAATTSLSFTLAAPATVDWTVVDKNGVTVRTVKVAEALAAGPYAFSWNGRNDAGAFVPRGTYRSVVRATDGSLAATQSVSVVADAFRITVSDTTPGRRQRITVTALSAEGLKAAPKLRIYQPGATAWSVTMTKVGTRLYRATVTLKSSRTGSLRLRVAGYDSGGTLQSSNLYLPLH